MNLTYFLKCPIVPDDCRSLPKKEHPKIKLVEKIEKITRGVWKLIGNAL